MIAGIDEAGRGPIIGPMVMCGVLINEGQEKELEALGVKFIATRDQVDLTTPAGRLFMQILGSLSEFERERILMEASLANECPYSFRHASQALEFIRETQGETQPSRRQELLSLLAIHVSKEPRRASALRPEFDAAGFTPAEWQQAVMIASYANFANRIAETMDLALEEGFEATCH